jgi:superfamily II DNA/RNA helicase
VAARGLDTTHVEHVIEAEFATNAVSHLHRIGRTGRAGRPGRVTCLVTTTGMDLARALAAAGAGADADDSLEALFSRRRSFRRTRKRAAKMEAAEAGGASGGEGDPDSEPWDSEAICGAEGPDGAAPKAARSS